MRKTIVASILTFSFVVVVSVGFNREPVGKKYDYGASFEKADVKHALDVYYVNDYSVPEVRENSLKHLESIVVFSENRSPLIEARARAPTTSNNMVIPRIRDKPIITPY